jgi:hypothetical protein
MELGLPSIANLSAYIGSVTFFEPGPADLDGPGGTGSNGKQN